jgi:hypothetical protein
MSSLAARRSSWSASTRVPALRPRSRALSSSWSTTTLFGVLAAGAFFYGAYRWAAQQNVPVVGDGIDGPEWNSSQYPNMFAAFGSTNDSYPSYTGMPAFFKSRGGSVYCGWSATTRRPRSGTAWRWSGR